MIVLLLEIASYFFFLFVVYVRIELVTSGSVYFNVYLLLEFALLYMFSYTKTYYKTRALPTEL